MIPVVLSIVYCEHMRHTPPIRHIATLLLWGCSGASETGQRIEAAQCERACLDSPYHRCGELLHSRQVLSCSALAEGVHIEEETPYRLTDQLGDPVVGLRRDGQLVASCSGEATLEVWLIRGEGCGMVEAIPQTCEALEAGLWWDEDVEAFTVEAITAEGALSLVDAYTADQRLWARTCPTDVEWVLVSGALADLGDVGLEW